ncbi:phage antirepressor KilAC domain-containing protein, partial [Endozoicomonas sp. SM1973]
WANEYDGRLVAEQKVTALEPKAAFAEEYLEADHNVALRYAAQELGLPPNIFNEKLRADKVLYTIDSRKNMPYQYYLEKGYFVVKTRIHARTGRAHLQTLVTPKGLYWLNKKYSHLKGFV